LTELREKLAEYGYLPEADLALISQEAGDGEPADDDEDRTAVEMITSMGSVGEAHSDEVDEV
jgi:hypothetical protein